MFKKLISGIALLACTLIAMPSLAEKINITDLAGRTVKVEHGAKRIILGEGRQLYIIAALDRENPFKHIVGWRDDLIQYDPDTYALYNKKFPEASTIKTLGNPYSSEIDIEAVISLKPDVVVFPLDKLKTTRETGVTDKLGKLNIPVVYIDFRTDPTVNTIPTIRLFGQILNQEDRARELIDFYQHYMTMIKERTTAQKDSERPLVFIEKAAGLDPNASGNTFGPANLGQLIEVAGGRNLGSEKLTGYSGKLSPEEIFAAQPQHIIMTGVKWDQAFPDSMAIPYGYDATAQNIQGRMQGLVKRPGWSSLRAVQSKQVHGIYHQFYKSPYNFIATLQFAKWFYPEAFKDVDTTAVYKEFHKKFLPIDYSGYFWSTLN
ncbi:ABC transporter substrate-binding protein [Endozoicomonas sp. Mp262]|uniref:ABC transporter substrate-binding protein n=1 Tax=Endozoicomonas sp. Mp262 TaxID=2919499 RepID=UPI0021E07C5F